MAKYHSTRVNGKNYREYARDYVAQGNTDTEDVALELECKFSMPESVALSLAKTTIRENTDFSRGIGIGGLGRHQEQPATPTAQTLRRIAQRETGYTRCDCGHRVHSSQVMNASTGTSCPRCYDRMSNQ